MGRKWGKKVIFVCGLIGAGKTTYARLYREGWLIEYTQKGGKHVSKHQR